MKSPKRNTVSVRQTSSLACAKSEPDRWRCFTKFTRLNHPQSSSKRVVMKRADSGSRAAAKRRRGDAATQRKPKSRGRKTEGSEQKAEGGRRKHVFAAFCFSL